MNAFAAQTTLNQLKMPDAETDGSGDEVTYTTMIPAWGDYGLAAFLRMSAEQRLQEFGPILGGDRVLRRVNKAVDMAWVSAGAV